MAGFWDSIHAGFGLGPSDLYKQTRKSGSVHIFMIIKIKI